MQPNEDDFKEWRQNAVTEWVFKCVLRHAERQKRLWANEIWERGTDDPAYLVAAKTNAAAYADIAQSSYEDWKAIDDTESE